MDQILKKTLIFGNLLCLNRIISDHDQELDTPILDK